MDSVIVIKSSISTIKVHLEAIIIANRIWNNHSLWIVDNRPIVIARRCLTCSHLLSVTVNVKWF